MLLRETRIAVVATSVLLGGAATATANEDGADTRHVTLPDGAIVALDLAGSGPPLVFIHGWSCNRQHWRGQMPVFAADHTVVALDLPGHGESTGERETWSIEQYGVDVAAVVTALELDSVVLVGHSMGGPVALEAARQLGPRVAGVVAVDTLQNVESEIDPKMREELEKLYDAYRKDFAAVCPQVVARMFIPRTDPELVKWVTEGMCRTRPEVAVALAARFPDYDEAAGMKAAGVPIRAINAQWQPTAIEVNRRYSPGFDVIILEGLGHFLQLEAPDRFNQALRQTLESLASATQEPKP
jgi:pimeloyl-ACP methyl ester carboxylesterase